MVMELVNIDKFDHIAKKGKRVRKQKKKKWKKDMQCISKIITSVKKTTGMELVSSVKLLPRLFTSTLGVAKFNSKDAKYTYI